MRMPADRCFWASRSTSSDGCAADERRVSWRPAPTEPGLASWLGSALLVAQHLPADADDATLMRRISEAGGNVFAATEGLTDEHVASVIVSGSSLFEAFGWSDDGHALDGTFRMTVPRPESFGTDGTDAVRELAAELFDAWDVRANDASPVGSARQAAIQKAAATVRLLD